MAKKKTQHSHYRNLSASHAAVAVAARAPSAVPAEAEPTQPLAGRPFLFWAIPALLAVLGSINTLWDGFASDDSQQILNNTLIRDFKNIPFAFTNSVWSFATSDIIFSVDSYYRPLFNVLLTINYG